MATPLDPESELVETIEGMLSDDKIVDAEVWVLKHWLDTHANHQSELAERSRRMIKVALADGELSNWELNEIRNQLQELICGISSQPPTHATFGSQSTSRVEATTEKKRRLSLTKRQLEEESGKSLLNLLNRIVSDGELSDSEILEIRSWLIENQTAALPAIAHLLDIVTDILADGRISDSERVDLFIGIEKVLPVTDRRLAKSARARAEESTPPKLREIERENEAATSESRESSRTDWRGNWRSDAMTEAQISFIRSLGGNISDVSTKGEASDLISRLLGEKPITNRQQMVMRFWARQRQPGEGPRDISEWMDQFYQEDSDRKLAWELFKNESEDNGLQGDPSRVPFGAGPKYLSRIKEGGEAAIPRFRPPAAKLTRAAGSQPLQSPKKTNGRWMIAGTFVAASLAVFAAFQLRQKKDPNEIRPPEKPRVIPALPTTDSTPTPNTTQTKVAVPISENALFVRRLKISGIIGGAQKKALIDGKAIGVGDVIDSTRGVLLESIDVERRTITFIDLAGGIYTRTLDY